MENSEEHSKDYKFLIEHQWNGDAITHSSPAEVRMAFSEGSVRVGVSGPLLEDSRIPRSPPGQPCDELWEYDVVEIFFLGEKDKYLEVEFCPHGQHLVLLLDGTRNMFKDKLPLQFTAVKDSRASRWTGSATIPLEYFPPGVCKMNAYAIHGSAESRQYEALYPASKDFPAPDFHRLQFFQDFNFKSLFPRGFVIPESPLWKARA
ncbi:UPF0462 protein C4orf33 homolog [Nematostella vectensis]|uniref:UPF0462 protein C4orf33 homolog n=1 Tax=Nematostella vectensis TaxID=45351 RepID=UPI0020778C3C|nr:UPF0462 protein C4orf33 homolog [Nematostella vectensis]XP_032235222.2 UPF0462 protein C4orf33 homolog [Nematostella vectensis]